MSAAPAMRETPAPETLDVALPTEAATRRFAEDVACALRAGDVVALSGDLGAGKTAFARALVRALAGDRALEVPSPTFPLRIDYSLPRFALAHVDLYRISANPEADELALDEALQSGALVIEWPDRLDRLPSGSILEISLAFEGEGRRALLAMHGDWPARLARSMDARAFLIRAGWEGAERAPMVGDASLRAYERIGLAGRTMVLMNAPARHESPAVHAGRSYDAVAHRALDVRPFVAIDLLLRENGVPAPEILAHDIDAGFLLLEDFGREGLVDAAGAPIPERYEAAIDLLAAMHGRAWPDIAPLPGGTHVIPPYDRGALLIEVSLYADWYAGRGGRPAFDEGRRAAFLNAWSDVLARIEAGPRTLVLRDYHSPNIMWRGDGEGLERLGILDFQDALLGHPAYDVASLAQDARVPIGPEAEASLKARYVAARRAADPGFDADAFEAAYAILALQRATKVLGAFTRLAEADGKTGYRRHMDHVAGLIARTLAHPVLAPLRAWYRHQA